MYLVLYSYRVCTFRIFQSASYVVLMTFGIIFQECQMGDRKVTYMPRQYVVLRMMWVILSMLLTMTFVGNLKSSLVKKSYEKRTMTLEEVIDKDITVHTSTAAMAYYDQPQAQLNPITKRLKCQAQKKDSIYVTGLVDNHYNFLTFFAT